MIIKNEFGRWGRVSVGVPYECIKDITKTLRKTYKGISSHSFGYCCMSDYDYYHKNCNENDYVDAKIFKGGLNNQYHADDGFHIENTVWFMWRTTEFNLDDIVKTMNEVAKKYNCEILKPKDEAHCIELYCVPTDDIMCRIYMALKRKSYFSNEPKEITAEEAMAILKSDTEIQIEILKLFN